MKWVEKPCSDFSVVSKVGDVEMEIDYGYGVRQGDDLAPALFLCVMQLVAERHASCTSRQ